MAPRRNSKTHTPATDLVLAYVRVSTDEQADSGAGLNAQRSAILAECERRGWAEVEIVEDAGYSAKDLKRPGIASALERLARGEASTLVVSKLDRLSRSVIDFAGLMERSRKEGWALVALDLGVDTTTPAGEMVAGVMAQFAQYECRLISQRTKDALTAKRAQGVHTGRRSTLDPDVRARIIAMHGAGVSFTAIAEALNTDAVPTGQGGARWWPATVRNIALAGAGAGSR